DAPGESLEEMGLFGIDVQVIHFDLRAGPGKARLPLKDIRVAVLFRQHHGLLSRIGKARRKNNLDCLLRLQSYATAKTENRIEDCAYSVRQWPIIHDGNRICGGMTATQEARPVGLILDSGDVFGRGSHHVNSPNGLILGGTRTPLRKQSLLRTIELGFHEEIAKSRVCQVAGG